MTSKETKDRNTEDAKKWTTIERKKEVCERCLSDLRHAQGMALYIQNEDLAKKFQSTLNELMDDFRAEWNGLCSLPGEPDTKMHFKA